MKVEKFGQRIVAEHILDPFGEFTLQPVHPVGPVPGPCFHRLVESVGDGLPTNDDDVAHGMKVIPLLVKFLSPRAPWDPVFFL